MLSQCLFAFSQFSCGYILSVYFTRHSKFSEFSERAYMQVRVHAPLMLQSDTAPQTQQTESADSHAIVLASRRVI